MFRTKLKDRILPDYTKGEEIFNMISHIVGGALGITATVLCVVFAALHHNVYGVVSGSIFGATMIILYAMSSIYHGLKPNTAKKVFQIIDHCSIYLLIAGTYTPFALCVLRSHSPALGWAIFGVIWGLTVLGIILNSIDLQKFEVISFILYICMGWCIVFTSKIVWSVIGATGFYLLLAGGIAYTVGAVMYCFTRKLRYIHSVFHIFVVIGSLLHFLCILLFIM